MNVFLSMLVSLALLFGGGSELPAVPESAAVTTIENLSLTLGGRTAALDTAFVLTTAAGTDEFAARFEIHDGEEILLPITGVLTKDKLSFSLTDASHYISISDSALRSSGVMEEIFGDEEEMESLAADLLPLVKTLEVAGSDPNFHYEDSRLSAEVVSKLLNKQPTQEQMEIGGETCLATTYSFTLQGSQLMALNDELLSCGNPLIEEFYRLNLESCRSLYGGDFETFADAAKVVYDPDTVENLVITLYEGEGWNYASTLNTSEGEEVNSSNSLAVLNRNGVQEIEFSAQSGETGILSFRGEIEGSMFAPERADLEFEITGTEEEAFAAKGTLSIEPGAWKAEMDYGDSMENLEDSAAVSLTTEGEVKHFSAELPDERIGLSFDIRTESAPYTAYFEGKTEKEHNLTSASKAQSQMNIDMLALAADAASFGANESVIELTNLLGGIAQQMAASEVPDMEFETPEGFVLEDSDMESYPAYAVYASGDKWITVEYYYYGEETMNFHLSPEGEITEETGSHIAVMYYPDYNTYSAYVTAPLGDYTMTFENMDDLEEVKAIIAAFCK